MSVIARLRPKASLWFSAILIAAILLATTGCCMSDAEVASLRADTTSLFYHGYHNYMRHAFPEDELRPISCKPQTRNREHPADIGLNDVLGNYSLTLIDSLSTLAILASAPEEDAAEQALREFQSGVKALVELYGDGEECGSRACAFDLDSKVQVFETNIRGVGGLLSAHLFATGELPIRSYTPEPAYQGEDLLEIQWSDGFIYDGQLLRLACDLAERLLPAFGTQTGLPYPRVNLRHGIPFYEHSTEGVCRLDGTSRDPRDITETCSAGAGSLVLEFATLSRLTGDPRFESLAKKAFWAVWARRSAIGLLGGGIDAESGHWTVPPLAGIGAGIDSFLEYAFKSSVLLSGLPYDADHYGTDAPESFQRAWEDAHAAVKHHIYRPSGTEKHPFYGQADLITGAPRYSWIDSLSAYYPGLLTLAGELDEAIETHLLYTALWTRYSALPERWHAFNGAIEPTFKHWAGRPEFIESTWYLYRATKDPFYLRTGEMVLRDIRRRCWAKCGWADLGDVFSGEQRDRMESFFLGETAKYLFLLFDDDHPLNQMDAPVVFTTEGHPLVIPKRYRQPSSPATEAGMRRNDRLAPKEQAPVCPAPPAAPPLTVSATAARHDIFHAAALAQLHLVPINPSRSSPLVGASASSPGISLADIRSPTNYTYYPWTLPQSLTPTHGFSSKMPTPVLSTLTFPNLAAVGHEGGNPGFLAVNALQKTIDGILINSLSNLRLNMVQEPKPFVFAGDLGVEAGKAYRIHGIANWALGRDEKVILSREALAAVSPTDPLFTRVKDLEMCDLVLDVPVPHAEEASVEADESEDSKATKGILDDLEAMFSSLWADANTVHSPPTIAASNGAPPSATRHTLPAILPTGVGAAPLPASMDADPTLLPPGHLPLQSILYLDDPLCTHRLPPSVARRYTILILPRGGCSFSAKLANIPAVAPAAGALQLVVVLSPPGEAALVRPLLDVRQRAPGGWERRHGLAMVMLEAAPGVVEVLGRVATARARFEGGAFMEVPGSGGGVGVRRRFGFESLGVPIGNLHML